MATDLVAQSEKLANRTAELLAFIKKELDADAEPHAKLQAGGVAELPHESQTGATLDLSHKNISSLPVEVIGLIKDKVERLALSHNPQISVPSQIVQCDRLRYLNIRWNQLIHFPEAILQLSKLEILDLSKNRIIAIPEDIQKLTSLKFLAVSRNRITRLPLSLGEMSSLGKLKFDENPIEFPPPDVLKLSPERSAAAFEADKEKDICHKVKRFLRAAAVKEKLRSVSEEDLSESNVETPRPPKRAVTAGRFPIRPSISGADSITGAKADSPADATPSTPPIPQRSHARVESSNAHMPKRPGIAPLLTNGNDISRSRSEAAASSVSLRQRRQGVVPPRRPTGDLGSVSEVSTRLSQASIVKPTHSRATSSISTINSFTGPSSSDTSGAISPVGGSFDNMRHLSSLPENRHDETQPDVTIKGSKRLIFTLSQLERPMSDIAVAIRDGVPRRSTLERQLFTATAHVKELDRLLSRLESGLEDGVQKRRAAMKSITRTAVNTMKSYGALTAELKRKLEKIFQFADGIYVRCLMFQLYGTMAEARNIATVLGFKVRDSSALQEASRASTWSSKSLTPTQPKAPSNRRPVKPGMLQGMNGSNSMLRAPLPVMPLNTNVSRTSAMTSQGPPTARSIESYSALMTDTSISRTSALRNIPDEREGDEQFDRIFLKLQAACNSAAQALSDCRTEFQRRKEMSREASQNGIAHQWSMALSKCEEVMENNKALKKRLEVVKVNDPGLRHQRDFWQLCDAFVHSWTELLAAVKDLGSQRADITAIKQIMRPVQRHVKDVSKTISNSALYHRALGNKGSDQPIIPPDVNSLPPSWNAAYPLQASATTHGGYITPVPATPLSAALGPAVQATVATPSTTTVPREYLQEPQTARQVRDRNDTPMQQPPYQRRVQ